jgi:hypothetical protein
VTGPEQADTEDAATGPGVDDDDLDDDVIPALLRVALKDRMHTRRFSAPDDPGHVDTVLGTGADAVAVVDDGPDHCMIGRPVGRSSDGCLYVLVARISFYGYEQLRDGEIPLVDAYADGRDISLVGLFEVDDTVENVMVVQHYRRADRVPDDYLPPSPFLEFDEAPSDEG